MLFMVALEQFIGNLPMLYQKVWMVAVIKCKEQGQFFQPILGDLLPWPLPGRQSHGKKILPLNVLECADKKNKKNVFFFFFFS